MRRIIIFAVCCMLSAVSACAQEVFEKVDSVEITARIDTRNILFGLSLNGREILPTDYEMVRCKDIGLIAFYKDSELYLYDTEGTLITRQDLDFEVDHRTSVSFDCIHSRDLQTYYELSVYYFDNNWGSQVIGTYCKKKGHLYKVKVIREFTLIK